MIHKHEFTTIRMRLIHWRKVSNFGAEYTGTRCFVLRSLFLANGNRSKKPRPKNYEPKTNRKEAQSGEPGKTPGFSREATPAISCGRKPTEKDSNTDQAAKRRQQTKSFHCVRLQKDALVEIQCRGVPGSQYTLPGMFLLCDVFQAAQFALLRSSVPRFWESI
jgi:hypothetical protein